MKLNKILLDLKIPIHILNSARILGRIPLYTGYMECRSTRIKGTILASETINPVETRENVAKAAEVFARHGDFLLRVFRKKLREQDAYDLWQDLFLTLTARPIPAGTQNIRGYLYRAAVHDIIDFKRDCRRCEKVFNKSLEKNLPSNAAGNPVQQLIGIETVTEAFRKIEENLPPAIGQAVLHKYRKQLSHREIAEKMNIKKKTVDRYLSVGTKMMEQIQDQIEGDKHEPI